MDSANLMLHIAAPLLLPIFILSLLGKGNWQKRWTSVWRLDSKESLISQKLFWVCLIIPCCFFMSFGLIAWKGYDISLTSKGLEDFIKISKFPLTLLSISVPFGVIVASFHSTQQTAEQIKITQHKNNLDSFYSHRNEFFAYFERLRKTDYLHCFNAANHVHPRLHKICFKGNPAEGTPEVNLNFLEDLERTFISAAYFLDYILNREYDERMPDYYICNACVSIHSLSAKLGLPEIYEELANKSASVAVTVNGKKEEYLTVGTTTNEIIAAFRYARDFYHNLCDFCGVEFKVLEHNRNYLATGGEFAEKTGYKNIEKIHSEYIKSIKNDTQIAVIYKS